MDFVLMCNDPPLLSDQKLPEPGTIDCNLNGSVFVWLEPEKRGPCRWVEVPAVAQRLVQSYATYPDLVRQSMKYNGMTSSARFKEHEFRAYVQKPDAVYVDSGFQRRAAIPKNVRVTPMFGGRTGVKL